MKNQFRSHPLKWSTLLETVERSGMKDPDIWIEDVRNYGPCRINGEPTKAEVVCKDEGTEAIEASFSVISDAKNNRIVIRHHY